MSELGVIAVFGLGFVLVVAGMVWLIVSGIRRTQARTASLAGLAAQREWAFEATRPGLEDRFPGDPFGRGSRRHATNVIEGRYEGRPFLAFDYHFTTGSGDDSTSHHLSVLAMHLGGAVVPMLQVSSQGPIGRFFSGLLGTDQLIGDPAFDDRFHVRTNSPEFAIEVLHPQLRQLTAGFGALTWRLQGDSLLTFCSGAHSPAEIDQALASMKALLDLIPSAVWRRVAE